MRVWRIDDPSGRAQLAVAAGALARLKALRALLDGEGGALAQLAVGGSTVKAASVTALVRAEESAARQFQSAMSALGLAPTNAGGVA